MARRPIALAVTLTASLVTFLIGVAAPAAGTTPPPDTTAPSTSAPDSTVPDSTAPDSTDPTTTEATTTTPLTLAPASRGTAIQETPTLPDPNTTTTRPPPPTTKPPSTTSPPPPPSVFAAPPNSGSGRRVVYSKSRMRVWIVESNGAVARTYRVSGRLSQPAPGTYKVFSRSSYTCNIKATNVCMRWMVRFTKGPSGDNIGFHEIPRRDGVPVQSDSQLGQALSGGCVRQSTADAWAMWNWAGIGTKVVVLG
jgi:lipoprotein-anchoring transpeptidase ErfK/SrfK